MTDRLTAIPTNLITLYKEKHEKMFLPFTIIARQVPFNNKVALPLLVPRLTTKIMRKAQLHRL